jgi:hypothetical protein
MESGPNGASVLTEFEMNKIRVNRLLLSGLVTLLVFIVAELVIESFIGRVLLDDIWGEYGQVLASGWGIPNEVLNIFIALFNSILLIWLYAALRPMFGVGTKTALIAGAFLYSFVLSFVMNFVNMGVFPARIAFPEMIFELIEFPIAIIAGAQFYERGL